MQIVVTCESTGDADQLRDWIENQEILTVEMETDEHPVDRDLVYVSITPHFDASTPLEAASSAQLWSRFVLQLFSQQLCY